MGTMELLGMEPGVIGMGIFKGQIGILKVVFAEGDGVAIDLDLVEIDLLFLFVFDRSFLEIAESG